jgi:uncharacterized membrane protein
MLYLQVLFILGLPFVLLKLEKKWKWFKAVVMAYVVGIAIGNIFTEAFDLSLITEITGVSIILAIPLMLFPTSLKSVLNQPKTLLLAYGLAVVATTISVIIGYWMFKDSLANIAVISGMVEGVYTGGTVNLNAIGIAFDVPKELVVLMNGFDWSFSGLYLLAVLTILPKLLGYILPKTKIPSNLEATFNTDEFAQLETKEKILSILKGVGLSVVLLGIMAGISFAIYGTLNELVLIFGVTGLALVLSNLKSVQSLKGNMVASDFLMLIFGFTLGLQANVSEVLSDRSELFSYFLITYSLMLVIHLLLAKLFKVDVHSFIISSTAAVFGPPFIGPVAESLGNRSLISSGIIISLIGNAVGTYLGIVIVKILLG